VSERTLRSGQAELQYGMLKTGSRISVSIVRVPWLLVRYRCVEDTVLILEVRRKELWLSHVGNE
jgi:hypothetical protein